MGLISPNINISIRGSSRGGPTGAIAPVTLSLDPPCAPPQTGSLHQ